MSVLEARGIHYSAGRTPILHDVDLSVAGGELVALIGPNGAGKSTALAALSGDIIPKRGTVTLDDRPLASIRLTELARLRSVLPQASAVAFSYSVRQIVELGRLPWQGVDDGLDDDTVVVDAMTRADVLHLADRDVTSLSGGEQARVAFARVLAQRCPVVLLDEPTAALDVGHQEQLLALARSLATEGAAVLAVLHDLDLAAAYADRVVLMHGGRVVAAGAPAEVMTAEALSTVYRHPIDVARWQHGGLVVRPRRGAAAGAPAGAAAAR